MQNATNHRYTLTEEKFKKVARGIQKKLLTLTPKGTKISLMTLMQTLSNELFAMPYEEAKATLLTKGVPLVRHVNIQEIKQSHDEFENLFAILTKDVRSCLSGQQGINEKHIEAVSMSLIYLTTLERSTPLESFEEIKPLVILRGSLGITPTIFIELARLMDKKILTEVARLMDRKIWDEAGGNMWEDRASVALQALGKALHFRTVMSNVGLSFSEYKNYLIKLDAFVDLAFDESIPRQFRSGLFSVLSSIDYSMPNEGDPNPKQHPSTYEQFVCIMMMQVELVNRFKSTIESIPWLKEWMNTPR